MAKYFPSWSWAACSNIVFFHSIPAEERQCPNSTALRIFSRLEKALKSVKLLGSREVILADLPKDIKVDKSDELDHENDELE